VTILHRIKYPPQRTGPAVASDLGEWECCADEVHTFYAPMVGLVVAIDDDHDLHMFCEADQVDAAVAALRGRLTSDAPPADQLPDLRVQFERILAAADEAPTSADRLLKDLRDCVYRHGLTGFETLGVLSSLTAELNAAIQIRDGLLAPGPDFRDEPEVGS
jgi:hypothetical protein